MPEARKVVPPTTGRRTSALAPAGSAAPFAAGALLAWFQANRREMPWRGHPEPYAVWVSEIMLQQTQVATVRPYFTRFMRRFPTVRALARARPEDVLKEWEGLGYYSRARLLHRAARQLVAEADARLPSTSAGLRRLPGIGPYTAAAIASICFGERVPVVDGNVARVFARYRLLKDDFRKPAARLKLADWLQPVFDGSAHPGDLNQAIMELGAIVCRPRNPNCAGCPLAPGCGARARGVQADYPVRRTTRPGPVRPTVAVVLRRGGRLLLTLRAEKGLLGGLWELPGGDIVPGETAEEAAVRLLRATTGLEPGPLVVRGTVKHAFSHFTQLLHIIAAGRARGRVKARPGVTLGWATDADLDRLPLTTATRRALDLRRDRPSPWRV
jgi:A/G-specific adenine glycosylase